MSVKSELYSFAFIHNAKGSRCHCSGETLNEYHVVTLQRVNLRRKGCLVQRKLNDCIVFLGIQQLNEKGFAFNSYPTTKFAFVLVSDFADLIKQ